MKLRFYIGVALIAIFVLLEKPNLLAKLSQINIQTLYIGKSIVFILAYFLLFVSLILIARSSNKIIKYSILAFISLSTLYADTYYSISGKNMEFVEFMILYQSKANILDALSMYHNNILECLTRIAILICAFIAIPPTLKKNASFNTLIGGGYISKFNSPYNIYFNH